MKLDVGVEVNGAIGDNACTVDLSEKHNDLVLAAREALDNAIKKVRPGVALREIGREIENTIRSKGFNPIVNLSGHGLGEYDIHCNPTIPNVDTGDENKLKEGMIFAIEPFATNGTGRVYAAGNATVFCQTASRQVRTNRDVLKAIEEFKGLPFCLRWLDFSEFKVKIALKEFMNFGMIKEFPPLVDAGKGLVSQAEHTVMVTKDGCEVLTLLS